MVKSAVDVESVSMSFAPTQFRGQRLLSGSLGPMMLLAAVAFGVVNIYRGETTTAAFFFVCSLVPAGLMAVVWPNHLRAVRRAASVYSGTIHLMHGGCGWSADEEPHDGARIGQGFVRIAPGVLEIRTGGEAKLVARYTTGQLERAVVLRVMWGLLEPPIRIWFTDGMTYDLMLDHAGPRGLLPLRRSYLGDFITDIRAALGYSGGASK